MSTRDSLTRSTVTFFHLYSKKFEQYESVKEFVIGVNIPTLFTTLKSTNRKETLTLFIDEKDQDYLGLELSDPFIGKLKTFKIPLLTMENNEFIKIPNMEYNSIISIQSDEFQQIIKDIQLVNGKTVDIKSINNQIIFSSNDGSVKYKNIMSELNTNEIENSIKFEKSTDEIIQGTYKLSNFLNYIKASHLTDHMNIYLSNKNPLILEYPISDIGVLRILIFGHVE